MKYFLIFLIIVTEYACGEKKEPKKEVVVIPPNSLFVITGQPVPTAYKVDTIQPWVILDSAETLKSLLKSIEDNYHRALQMQQMKRNDTSK